MPVVPGAAIMFLVGNPGKHEMFVARVRYPEGSPVIPPHWHNTTYNLTVLRGTLVIGMGDSIDSTAVQRLGPGSFLVLEGGMNHYEWFEGKMEMQIAGVGPLRTVFPNSDDSRR